MAKCALTTIDNPYDPFEEFDAWYAFDCNKGHHSCSLLDRIARTSSQFSDEENDNEIERAIDEIIKFDVLNIYRKVTMPLDAEEPVVSDDSNENNVKNN